MSDPIRTAVIPAAGLGTRFLPVTKTIPKEMLAILGRPIIQYIVQQAVDAGIDHIVLVLSSDKRAIPGVCTSTPSLVRAVLRSERQTELRSGNAEFSRMCA